MSDHGKYAKTADPFVMPSLADQEWRFKAGGGVCRGDRWSQTWDPHRAGKIVVDPQSWVTWSVLDSNVPVLRSGGTFDVTLEIATNNDAWEAGTEKTYKTVDAAAKAGAKAAERIARIMVKCAKKNDGFVDANDVHDALGD